MLELAERAPIYAWLSRLLVREIQAEDWDEIRSVPIRSILGRLDPLLHDDLATALSPERKEALAEEFARLFLMPGGASPFASSWLAPGASQEERSSTHNRSRDEITLLVGRSFVALGREPIQREPWGRLARDHVAVILDLVARAQASNETADRELAAHLDRELLGAWLTSFGRALDERARVPLYRALGRLLTSLHAVE